MANSELLQSTHHFPSPPKTTKVPLVLRGLRWSFRTLGPVFPNLMGRLAYNLWFTPQRKAFTAWEQKANDSADRRYFLDDAGRKIAVYQWGDKGPAALCLHGWGGRSAQFGKIIPKLVASGYRVIAFDGPAHGASEGSKTNLEEFWEIIKRLEEKEGPFSVAVSHSFGGVVLSFALAAGFNVDKAVMISPPCQYQYIVDTYKKIMDLPDKVVAQMVLRTRRRFAHWPYDFEDMMDIDQNAPRFKTKAMVIHDVDDDMVAIEQGRLVARSWPGATYVETRGLGHRAILRDPQVIQKVDRFLQA